MSHHGQRATRQHAEEMSHVEGGMLKESRSRRLGCPHNSLTAERRAGWPMNLESRARVTPASVLPDGLPVC